MPTPLLIILDTNVLVSGLLKRNSIPGQVLDLILGRKVRVAIEPSILDEYARVLERPRLGISPEQASEFLLFFAVTGQRISVPMQDLARGEWPDQKDIPFAQAAIAARVQVLVTGNQKHFQPLAGYGIQVLAPAEFLARVSHLWNRKDMDTTEP